MGVTPVLHPEITGLKLRCDWSCKTQPFPLNNSSASATPRSNSLITETDRFVCPIDGTLLKWPDGACETHGDFRLPEIQNLSGDPGSFTLHDFRPSEDYIVQDREMAQAHAKIISGMLAFEPARLAEAGYESLEKGIREDASRHQSLMLRASYFIDSWIRNIRDFARWRLTGRYSQKGPNPDAIASSFDGYGRVYDMMSSFTTPAYLGVYEGHLRHVPFMLTYYGDMQIVNEVIRRWDCTDVLEFGCGNGVNLMLLRDLLPGGKNLNLSGFDYALSRVLTARATFEYYRPEISNLFLADGRKLPLADDSFDMVYSHWVVEQMAGFEDEALDEMLRVSRKGIVLIEPTINKPRLTERVLMAHSGYSTRLTEIIRARTDIEIEEIRDIRDNQPFLYPNVLMVLRKK
jgi:ubiquinone/menaquinone biosynthesis C-methylase UbiE